MAKDPIDQIKELTEEPKGPLGMAASLLGSVVGTVADINRSIRQDLRDMTPPEKPTTTLSKPPSSSSHMRSDIANTIASAKDGLGSVDLGEEEPLTTSATAPLPPSPAKSNPLDFLRDPAKHGLTTIDSYFHTYNAADIPSYIKDLEKEVKAPYTFGILAGEGKPSPMRDQILGAINHHPRMFGALGMGPRDLWENQTAMEDELVGLLNDNPRLLAVGPVGVDMNFNASALKEQAAQMLAQIAIAGEFGLPVFIMHRKGSVQLRQALLSHVNIQQPLVFLKPVVNTDDRLLAETLGCHLLIRSEITYPEHGFYRETLKAWPKNKLLLGCGNALVAPISQSGQFNGPTALPAILKQAAETMGLSPQEAKLQFNRNALNLFFQGLIQ